jgi:hypothetical protein
MGRQPEPCINDRADRPARAAGRVRSSRHRWVTVGATPSTGDRGSPIAEVQRASSVRVTYLTFGAVRAACVSAGSGTPIGPASFFQIADSARVPTRRGDSNTCRSGACTRL